MNKILKEFDNYCKKCV